MNQSFIKKYLNIEKLPFVFSALAGIISLFFFFMPFLYSIDSKTNQPIFVTGFSMLSFMEDSYMNIHYGVILFLIGYVFSGLLAFFGIMGIVTRKELFKSIFSILFVISFFQTGAEITGMVFLSGCEKMNLFLEFGSYVSVITKGILLLFLIGYFVYFKMRSTKAS